MTIFNAFVDARLPTLGGAALVTAALTLTSCGFGTTEPTPTTPDLPSSNGVGTPTTPTTTTPPTSTPSTGRFELSAGDGELAFSSALGTIGANGSFEVMFRPVEIRRGPSGFSNAVEFWLDRGPEASGMGLGFGWMPDSLWRPYIFLETRGFDDLRPRRQIDVNGRFRTIRIVRTNGATEWFLDSRSLVVVDDPVAVRTVYVRVVGTRSEFQVGGTP